MRQFFFLLTIITFLSASCKKSTPAFTIQPGTYKGTFKRSYYPAVSNVVLTFTRNRFEGQADTTHYPDICKGGFSTSNDSVSFKNECVYTANFDWSYILSGNFKLIVTEDSLFITRGAGDIIHYDDIYKLKRQ